LTKKEIKIILVIEKIKQTGGNMSNAENKDQLPSLNSIVGDEIDRLMGIYLVKKFKEVMVVCGKEIFEALDDDDKLTFLQMIEPFHQDVF